MLTKEDVLTIAARHNNLFTINRNSYRGKRLRKLLRLMVKEGLVVRHGSTQKELAYKVKEL